LIAPKISTHRHSVINHGSIN